MKNILVSRVFLLGALLAVTSLGAKADLINLNFAPGSTDVAGVYGSDGQTWNGFNSNYQEGYTYQYPATALLDYQGNGSGVDVTFSGTGGGNTPNYNYAGFDPRLFGHYLYVNVGESQSIDFSGLAAGNYDLVLYSNNNNGGTLTFDVNGTPESFSPTSESGFSINNNYVSIDATVGSNTDLNITAINTDGGGFGFSGLQIEALPASVPEPSILGMFAGGGLLLVFFLRRKAATNS